MRLALALLLGTAIARAAEPVADPATRHLPASVFVVVRVAAFERLEAIGRDWKLRTSLGNQLDPAQRTPLPVNRARPFYIGVDREHTYYLLHAIAGTKATDLPATAGGRKAQLVDGMIRLGPPAPARAQPIALLPGDVAVALDVGALVNMFAKELADVREELARVEQTVQKELGVPRSLIVFVKRVADSLVRTVGDVESVHYALTWRAPRLDSEGWLRTKPRSALAKWLQGFGEPAPHDLMSYLPRNAFYMLETCGPGAWLDSQVAGWLDDVFGDGTGRPLLTVLAPNFALSEHLTGRAAGAVSLPGWKRSGRSSRTPRSTRRSAGSTATRSTRS